MSSVLVVAAHPDDELLGCGGTLARHIREGDSVSVLILGEGLTSRQDSREQGLLNEDLDNLHTDMKMALGKLGIRSVFSLAFPDNRFDSVPLLDVVKAVEGVKKRVEPELVYTHYIGDLNIDHRITVQAVLTAFRPQPGESVKEIYSFEVPSSTLWMPGETSSFNVNYYVDITEYLDLKLRALSCYQSEIRPWPHARSLENIESLAKMRGASIGVEAAEAFILLRGIR